MPGTITNRTIYGGITTGGAGEETVLLSLDGNPGIASIPVPAGTTLAITDILPAHLGGATTIKFKLQQANDGVSFFNVGVYNVQGVMNTPIYNLKTAIVVDGDQGPNVQFRVRVVTPGGTLLSITLRAYTE